jgi:hypothetical protein
MKITRVDIGADGQSHFEEIEVEIEKRGRTFSLSGDMQRRN